MESSIIHTIGSILVFAVIGSIGLLINRRIKLPFSLVLVVLGFLLSLIVEPLGWNTGIRASNFQDVILFVLLPVLIFESAFSLHVKILMRYLPNVLTLATLGIVLSALIIAVVLFYGINHPGFPFIAALLTGVVISATDPVAVVAQLKQLKAPADLNILIEGESLFNDATAIVLFGIILSIATGSEYAGFGPAVWTFLKVFVGGILLGAILGGLAAIIVKWIEPSIPHLIFITLVLAYGSLYIGEHVLHISGIVAVLVSALIFKRYAFKHIEHHLLELHHVWETLAFVANVFVFVLLGLVVSINMFTEMYIAIGLAIFGAFIARIVAVYVSVLVNKYTIGQNIPASYPPIMIWGGLRGAVTIALVLSLPTSIPYWWTIQSIGFGIVIFSLVVQATTNPILVKRMKIGGS